RHDLRAPPITRPDDRRRHPSTGIDPPARRLPALSRDGTRRDLRVHRRPRADDHRRAPARVPGRRKVSGDVMMPTAGVIDLSVWQLGLAAVLVGVMIVISARQALGLERDLVVGAVRTIVQLYVVGFVLASVFAAGRWYWVVLVLIAMTLVATQAAVSRL